MPDAAERLRRAVQHLMSDKEVQRRVDARIERQLRNAVKGAFKPERKFRVRKPRSRPAKVVIRNSIDRFREDISSGNGRNIIAGVTKLGTFKRYLNNVNDLTQSQFATGSVTETLSRKMTWDQIHPKPYNMMCGPFKSINVRVPTAEVKKGGLLFSSDFPGFLPKSRWEYVGNFAPGQNWGQDSLSSYTSANLSSFPDLSSYHTKAYDILKPKLQKANALQFLYELRDMPGQLETTANLFHNLWRQFSGRTSANISSYGGVLMSPSNVADNFLNLQFGWIPFISDYIGMFQTWQNLANIVGRTVRDNNTWMKRKSVIEEEDIDTRIQLSLISDTEPNNATFPMNQMVSNMNVGGQTSTGFTEIHVREYKRTWASGWFLYSRPEFDGPSDSYAEPMNDLRRLMTIFGVRINPTFLYKITPWSWLVDWFTGFGKFIERHDDFVTDGIVSRATCVMQESLRSVTKTCAINFSGSGLHTFTWQRNLSLKQRDVADSPYGFNVPWNQLTLRQFAILGALGITRTNSGFISRGA
jgi:hypothetical protein